jgi:DNA-binding GntR family transcriptional regulator
MACRSRRSILHASGGCWDCDATWSGLSFASRQTAPASPTATRRSTSNACLGKSARRSHDGFNRLDRRIDALILEAAGEPFLAHTLRPLHTIYRRIGYIYHQYLPGHIDLSGTVDRHLSILNAVANRRVERAVAASDALIDFMDQMFEEMESGIDPGLLDCSIEPLPGT